MSLLKDKKDHGVLNSHYQTGGLDSEIFIGIGKVKRYKGSWSRSMTKGGSRHVEETRPKE